MEPSQVKICLNIIDDMVFTNKILKVKSFVTKIKGGTVCTFRFNHNQLEKLLSMLQAICTHKDPVGLLYGLKTLWVILLQKSVIEDAERKGAWSCYFDIKTPLLFYRSKACSIINVTNEFWDDYRFGCPSLELFVDDDNTKFISYWSVKLAPSNLTYRKWKQTIKDFKMLHSKYK